MTLYQRLLVRLLHLANSSYSCDREFYGLKDRLLRKYGRCVGQDIQEIKKACWGQYPYDDDHIPCGPKCRRCGGTGVFDIRWVHLSRYEWLGYTFHRPECDTRRPPDPTKVTIIGRVKHRDYGLLASEATLWLYVLSGEWRLLWRTLRGSSYARPRFWPLLNLQRVVMWTCLKVSRHRCYQCHKRFFTGGSGWQICRRCRKADEVRHARRRNYDQEGIPF